MMPESVMQKHVEDALLVASEVAKKEDAKLGDERSRGWIVALHG